MNKQKLNQIAKSIGTPSYIFDTDAFSARAERVKAAFGDKVSLCFSIKANPFLLKHLPDTFRYIEVCSPGELTICENTDTDLSKVIFSGVNKTRGDVWRAMSDNVAVFTAESLLHVKYINECAVETGKKVDVILRLSDGSQFGMDKSDLINVIKNREGYDGLNIIGLHYFTGTQKKKAAVIQKELNLLDEFCVMLKNDYGFDAKHIEYGTGLAVDYFKDDTDDTDYALLDEVAVHIRAFAEKYNLTVEMGRFFAACCGTYLTKVMDTKHNHDTNYAICDGGINQVKYFGQTMAMQIPKMDVLGKDDEKSEFWSLCGSLCTTADVLVRKVELPPLEIGDVIAFHRTGAYSVAEGIAAFLSREMPRVALYSESSGVELVRDYFFTDVLNTPQ